MKLQNIIAMMGPPGSGKGTQTKLLAESLGYEYFSTGALSRDYAKQDTEFGRAIKNFIDQGIILPIEIIREIFTKKFDSILDSPGVILDGYPRTMDQVSLLDELIKKYQIKDLQVLFINVDKANLMKRLETRKTCGVCNTIYKANMTEFVSGVCSKCGGKLSLRADDDPAIVEKRFDEYLQKTAPVKEHYETAGKLIHIKGDHSPNADESIKGVHQEILDKLGIKTL